MKAFTWAKDACGLDVVGREVSLPDEEIKETEGGTLEWRGYGVLYHGLLGVYMISPWRSRDQGCCLRLNSYSDTLTNKLTNLETARDSGQ